MPNVEQKRAARYKLGKLIVGLRVPILVVAIALVIPCAFAMQATRTNFDMLTYLPDSMDTVKGQDVLYEDFGKGAFCFIIVEGMDDADVADLKAQIEAVDHVDTVLWSDSLTKAGIPKAAIPKKYYDAFNSGDDTMMAVFFDSTTSSDATIAAVEEIRSIGGKQTFLAGMSALVVDLKNLAEREEATYVAVAVLGSVVMLLLLTDSWLVPFIFLASIGIAIMWNMGTNIVFGEISFITKALAAVLQLAVTMDYSIFLWHSFTEQREKYPDDHKEAMAVAIGETLTALFSSMLTASAGFLALCFMTYTLGMDLGLVMAKGCVLGFIGSLTTLPALILLFEKPLYKFRHKPLIPRADRLANHVTKRFPVYLLIFAIVLVPAAYGFMNKPVYYDFTKLLVNGDMEGMSEEDLGFHYANEKLLEDFDVGNTQMIMCKADLPHAQAKEMLDRIDEVDGVKYAIGYDSLFGGGIPEQALPERVRSALKAGGNQLILVNSAYQVSTDEVNAQIDEINEIIKEYDDTATLIGEAPATKDLIATTDRDFRVVDWIAIAGIGAILLIVFRSISLPIILVLVIEFAIMINLGLPYYMNDEMMFIAPICISTIQLGSTVNYAILLTTRYRKERYDGLEKQPAIATALSASLPSVVTSGLSFFAATFSVALFSNLGVISSLCTLMARGAIISTLSVLFILPAFFMLADPVIIRTSKHFRKQTSEQAPAATMAAQA